MAGIHKLCHMANIQWLACTHTAACQSLVHEYDRLKHKHSCVNKHLSHAWYATHCANTSCPLVACMQVCVCACVCMCLHVCACVCIVCACVCACVFACVACMCGMYVWHVCVACVGVQSWDNGLQVKGSWENTCYALIRTHQDT